jgi:TIR domain
MQPTGGVFVNYRRDDAGQAAGEVADALHARLPHAGVFLDRSIVPGTPFPQELEDAVRRSVVLLALIGPRWDEPPLVDRLREPDDWVRQEIVIARRTGTCAVVPVLVDRPGIPAAGRLPDCLRFLSTLQAVRVRQGSGRDLASLAEQVAARVPMEYGGAAPPGSDGVPATPVAIDALLRLTLPRAEQASGNRDRLVELALTVLQPGERLLQLTPAQLQHRPRGSATVLATERGLVVVDVGQNFRTRPGTNRYPYDRMERIEVVLTRWRLVVKTADVLVHLAGGGTAVLSLDRPQAQALAAHLRARLAHA